MRPLLADRVFDFLQDSVLNPAVLAAVAGAFGLPALPAGVVVSMRGIVIHSKEVRFFPAFGAFGGLPPNLRPSPRPAQVSR